MKIETDGDDIVALVVIVIVMVIVFGFGLIYDYHLKTELARLRAPNSITNTITLEGK